MQSQLDRQLFCTFDWSQVDPLHTLRTWVGKKGLRRGSKLGNIAPTGIADASDDEEDPLIRPVPHYQVSRGGYQSLSAESDNASRLLASHSDIGETPPASVLGQHIEAPTAKVADPSHRGLEDDCSELWGRRYAHYVDDHFGAVPIVPLRSQRRILQHRQQHPNTQQQQAKANSIPNSALSPLLPSPAQSPSVSLTGSPASTIQTEPNAMMTSLMGGAAQRISRRERFRMAGWDLKVEDADEWLKHAVTNHFLAATHAAQQSRSPPPTLAASPPQHSTQIPLRRHSSRFNMPRPLSENMLATDHVRLVVHPLATPVVRLGVLKQGWLKKQSQTLKVWRWRWVVLTRDALLTYRWDDPYADIARPTMMVPLHPNAIPTQTNTDNPHPVAQIRLRERDKRFSVRCGEKWCVFEAASTDELFRWHQHFLQSSSA